MSSRGESSAHAANKNDEDRGAYSFSFELSSASGKRAPVLAYFLLVAAILAVSSAGLVFKDLSLTHVGPLTLAAWRLQATTVILIPPCIWQLREATEQVRADTLKSWWLLAASGSALALHFGAWVWGLEHTSLPHALLFVTSSPLLIVTGCLILRHPISRGEVVGAVAAFVGMLVLCAGAVSSGEVTVVGDAMSLLGALAFVGYIHVGRALREWMPVFVYAAPVTGISALLLTLLGLAFEKTSFIAGGPHGTFGYLSEPSLLLLVTYLAFGPGLVGHTGINTLLKFFSPLVISIAFTLEPLVGSVLAWMFGVAAIPGVLTWIGGTIVMGAMMYLTYCESRRVGLRDKKAGVSAAIRAALDDDASVVEMTPFTIIEDEDFFDEAELLPSV